MFTTAVRLLARAGSSSTKSCSSLVDSKVDTQERFSDLVQSLWGSRRKATKSRSSHGVKKPIDPKVDTEEAFRLSDLLHSILNKHGPLTAGACWTHAEVAGFRSKTHMKIMLRWMKERHRVKLIGRPKNKKFDEEDSMRYATMFYNEFTEGAQKD